MNYFGQNVTTPNAPMNYFGQTLSPTPSSTTPATATGGIGPKKSAFVGAPVKPRSTAAAGGAATTDYGTQSGPGILQQWFDQRANGTDPGYEYAMNRGMDAIDNRMAAGGSYNSGARGQQLSDYAANMGAQREGQLDSLAGGASGEHQGQINSMFSQGLGLAGGEAGTTGAYDLASANSNNALMNALVQMMGGKAGIDSAASTGLLNNLFSLGGAYLGGRKGGSGG